MTNHLLQSQMYYNVIDQYMYKVKATPYMLFVSLNPNYHSNKTSALSDPQITLLYVCGTDIPESQIKPVSLYGLTYRA